ncbi:hypothetical protein EU538_12565 [Candidatus Thorarchaeota archaeon]|nr:MAG: hypothetical protein EU538_12565 [Candidatus Thorarchaeota archaeon]
MNCDSEFIEATLIELIESHPEEYGIPLEKAVILLLRFSRDEGKGCTEDDIRNIIEQLLDDWIINKTLDHVSQDDAKEFSITPMRPVWHLKLLSDQESKRYRNLDEREKALIKILREKTDPEDLGRMRVDEAVELLRQEGLTEDTEHIYVEDVIRTSFDVVQGELIPCYEIVDEFSKTPEWKAEMERQSQRVMQKMMWDAEIEAEDRARAERKEKKKGKKGA